MQEIRFHGRGGQGAVTSAELIAIAAINKGQCAQAFPSFGPERRGAPVVAFCRVDDNKIHIRAKVYDPDVVIVLDPGLLDAPRSDRRHERRRRSSL
ncbi:MAG: 2-oxoacid:acceptor oxidoreductase family protein [Anaerotruncus sp.]|nr:2-oxoacid:acceptor oxidoreductase family protein [Anaerotruncus sp.]